MLHFFTLRVITINLEDHRTKKLIYIYMRELHHTVKMVIIFRFLLCSALP